MTGVFWCVRWRCTAGSMPFRASRITRIIRVPGRNVHRWRSGSTPVISAGFGPRRSRISRQRHSWPRNNGFRGSGTEFCRIFCSGRGFPKRKLATLGDADAERLFRMLKSVLREMTDRGGRDTEKDLFGKPGGYAVQLSRNTCAEPCPVCGGPIVKEAYLGGTVYYCPGCQPLK